MCGHERVEESVHTFQIKEILQEIGRRGIHWDEWIHWGLLSTT